MRRPPASGICPTCHQRIFHTHDMRFGVRVTMAQAAVIDKLQEAGDRGMTGEELRQALSEKKPRNFAWLKAHIWRLESVLGKSDWHIAFDRGHLVLRKRILPERKLGAGK